MDNNKIIFHYCYIYSSFIRPFICHIAVRWACFHLKWKTRRIKKNLHFHCSIEWVHSIAFKSKKFIFDFAFLLIVCSVNSACAECNVCAHITYSIMTRNRVFSSLLQFNTFFHYFSQTQIKYKLFSALLMSRVQYSVLLFNHINVDFITDWNNEDSLCLWLALCCFLFIMIVWNRIISNSKKSLWKKQIEPARIFGVWFTIYV